MKFIDSAGVEFNCPVTFTGTVTTTPSSPATASYMVKRWVSPTITQADLTGGQASQSVNLTGFPGGVVLAASYLQTTATSSSSNGGTTGATLSLGISGSTQAYLATGANVLGAAARLSNAAGTLLGTYRASDVPQVTITATGGSPDLAHLTLSCRAVVYYLEVTAES
ncbi:hypothetical protein [Nannocystis sp. SCPEA4]|uniref:hypothetical protein n=1 Tax=Nannocystis sp. SCPEA4 TaxID=2996787 RepID=UPI0022707248|nr:hypothetical protein [Nannocystis sp. SCPEA4]MCY1055426.1 hypothetical protein [Nannocystis sp. SCPEA4]